MPDNSFVLNKDIPISDSFCVSDVLSVLPDSQIIRTIMDTSDDAIYFKDRDSIFILSNLSHSLLFGLKNPFEIRGKSDADFRSDSYAGKSRRDELEIMRTGEPQLGIIEKLQRDGSLPVWFSSSKYPLYNEAGEIIGTWGTIRNITDLKLAEQKLTHINARLARANAQIQELAGIDELSGLFNRRNFEDVLKKTFTIYLHHRQRSLSVHFCLLIIEINNFKLIRDTVGQKDTDTIIRHISDLLAANNRQSDYSFRYGEHEFAVILPETDRESGKAIAEKLKVIVADNPLRLNSGKPEVTINVGISCFDSQEDSVQMVQEANSGLYQSGCE